MPSTLFIKNMVCQRCILTVERMLNELEIPFQEVTLGELLLTTTPEKNTVEKLDAALQKVGFELIESRITRIIEEIKRLVLEYIDLDPDAPKKKLSTFITDKVHYDYSYLSDLFSTVESRTIEQFFIHARIEKVKESIVYDQLSLTEIAYQTGFSSVHHLSSQFKKVTGLNPSHFKKIGLNRRKYMQEL